MNVYHVSLVILLLVRGTHSEDPDCSVHSGATDCNAEVGCAYTGGSCVLCFDIEIETGCQEATGCGWGATGEGEYVCMACNADELSINSTCNSFSCCHFSSGVCGAGACTDAPTCSMSAFRRIPFTPKVCH